MRYLVIGIIAVLLIPVFYKVTKTIANRSLFDEQLTGYLNKIVNQGLRENNHDDWIPVQYVELERLSSINPLESKIKIDVFIQKVSNTVDKYNSPQNLIRILATISGGTCTIDFFDVINSYDTGRLIPENTSALNPLSAGVVGKIREKVTSQTSVDTLEQFTETLPVCNKASSRILCTPRDKFRTDKKINLPLAPLLPEFGNFSTDVQTTKDYSNTKSDCIRMKPYFSDFRLEPSSIPFKCRTRYDLDNNPNRADVDQYAVADSVNNRNLNTFGLKN